MKTTSTYSNQAWYETKPIILLFIYFHHHVESLPEMFVLLFGSRLYSTPVVKHSFMWLKHNFRDSSKFLRFFSDLDKQDGTLIDAVLDTSSEIIK